jgi:hypothetical protein
MKSMKLNLAATFTLLFVLNTTLAQNKERRNRDERNDRNENYDNNRRNDRNEYSDRDSDWDEREDNDRIRNYERGRNRYECNPYDYRNLPQNWNRQKAYRFDWFSFDWENQFDPRYGNRNFDSYYPWDPNNRYDIRNSREYYGNNQYWSGSRPNRIIIVPSRGRQGYSRWHNRNFGSHYGHGHGRR